MAAGMVDENAAHDLCGDTKEVRPVLPIDLPLIHEPQVRLVDERRRLQAVPRLRGAAGAPPAGATPHRRAAAADRARGDRRGSIHPARR
jgi:hypothetical protein